MPVSAKAAELLNDSNFYAQAEEKQINQLSQASPDFNALPYESKQRILKESATRIKQKTNVPGTPWYRNPTVPLDKLVTPPSPGQSGPEQVARGAAQGVAQGVSGMTSPESMGAIGAMTLGGKLPVVGGAVRAAGAVYFTYQQARQIVESIPELKRAYEQGNMGEIGRVLGQDAVAALVGYKTGKGLAEGARAKLSRPAVKGEVLPPDPYSQMGRAAKEAQSQAPPVEPPKPWWQKTSDEKLAEARKLLADRGGKPAPGSPAVPEDAPGHVKTWASGREGLGARTAAPEGYTFPKTLPGKDTVAAAREEPVSDPGAQHGPPEPPPSHKAQAKAYGERSKPPDFEDVYGEMGKRVAGKYPTKEAAEAYPDTAAKPPAAASGKPAKATAEPVRPKEAAPAKPLADEESGNLNKRREEFVKLQKDLKALPDSPARKDMLAKVSRNIESIDAALKQKKGTSDSKKTDARPAATSGGSKGKIAAGEPALKSAPAGAQKAATPPEPPPSQKGTDSKEPNRKADATQRQPFNSTTLYSVPEASRSILEDVRRARVERFHVSVKDSFGSEIWFGDFEGDTTPESIEAPFAYLRDARKIEFSPIGRDQGIKVWVKMLSPQAVQSK